MRTQQRRDGPGALTRRAPVLGTGWRQQVEYASPVSPVDLTSYDLAALVDEECLHQEHLIAQWVVRVEQRVQIMSASRRPQRRVDSTIDRHRAVVHDLPSAAADRSTQRDRQR